MCVFIVFFFSELRCIASRDGTGR